MAESSKTTISVGSLEQARDVCRLAEQVVGSGGYFWLQSDLLLEDIKPGLPVADQITQFASGRAFSPRGEVRWRSDRGKWSVTVICDSGVPEGFIAVPGEFDPRPHRVALFGQRTPGKADHWRDTRYSRVISYPQPARDTAWVGAIEYIDRSTGRVHFVRWTGFGGQADAGR
ncbi:MAG TPA: hypothetical protein V6D08_00920 [Candidatus Obscuribacterales bacterium]